MSGDDERITWDQYFRTALVLRQTTDCSEDELFAAAWAFLKRAHVRYYRHRYNSIPPLWDQGAFDPPLISLEDAAVHITGNKRNKVQALAALEEFLGESSWLLKEARERGELSKDFCAQVKEEYRKWRMEPVREKQRQAGRKSGNLTRKSRARAKKSSATRKKSR